MLIESCSSTNEYLKALIERNPTQSYHGQWVSAREQTQGKGTKGRSWDSKRGGVYLSYFLKNFSPAEMSWIPLRIGVAIAEAFSDYQLQLKWPNDCYRNGKKCGGILCEGVQSLQPLKSSGVIVGVGLNTQECYDLSEAWEMIPLTTDEVRTRLLQALNHIQPQYLKCDQEYMKFSLLKPGQRIAWKNLQTSETQEDEFSHLGLSGELVTRHHQSLWSEDVHVKITV
jgi:biotin-[acetyl-CoA-carboxylase] ligase BirA-like protein